MGKRARALTMIEVLILGGIFFLVSILALPLVRGARITANEQEAVQILRNFKTAALNIPEGMKIGEYFDKLPDAKVETAPDGKFLVSYHGYLFRLYTQPYKDQPCMIAYAWPRKMEQSGTAVFTVKIEEQAAIRYSHNVQMRYSGESSIPAGDAAIPRSEDEEDMWKDGSFIGNDHQKWILLAKAGD